MKKRTFYPRQVLRKLQGIHASLDDGQKAALRFVMRRGRKLGYSVFVGTTATAADKSGAVINDAASLLRESAPTRVTLHPAI